MFEVDVKDVPEEEEKKKNTARVWGSDRKLGHYMLKLNISS